MANMIDATRILNQIEYGDPAASSLLLVYEELRVLGPETASSRRISSQTAIRRWAYGRAWLYTQLQCDAG